MGQIAQSSGDKHLYAYITSSKGAVMGGWANLGVLCSGRRASRVGISRYFQGNVIGTARVINFFQEVIQESYLMVRQFS